MKDNLNEFYVSIVKLMNSLEEEYDDLMKQREINLRQRKKLSTICTHDVVLRTKIGNLRFYCLCCNKEVHTINDNTIVIDMDNKFGEYLFNLNYDFFDIIYRDVCEYMSKFMKSLLSQELENYARNYLSGRKLR